MTTPAYLLGLEEGYDKMYNICSAIYMARNITLDNSAILEQLRLIDRLFATPSEDYAYELENRAELMNNCAEEISILA